MRRLTLAILAVLGVASCGGADSQPSSPSTPPEPTVASADAGAGPDTGSFALDRCIETLSKATAGLDLDASDARNTLGSIVDGEPVASDCGFLQVQDPESAVGLPINEIVEALEAHLPAGVLELLAEPVPVPFEHIADEL